LADENEDVDEALEIDIDEPYTIFEVNITTNVKLKIHNLT
jgi:hypothetical protein